MDPVTLNLTLEDVPIRTSNAHDGWQTRHVHAKAARLIVKLTAKARGVRFEVPVRIKITLLAPDRIRRDPDNLAAAAKPIIDGLVDAGWIRDDSWRHVSQVSFSTFPAADVALEPGWVVQVEPKTHRAALRLVEEQAS